MRALLLFLAVIGGPARAQGPSVVTDIAPVHSLVSQVMGDLGQPVLLFDPGTDPHHVQLRPSQGRSLAGADLLVWIGPAMTPWLGRSLASLAPDARSLPLLEAPDAPMRIEGGAAHSHDESHEPASEDHDHGALDPHAWLDPLNARFYLTVIADELALLDPPNAAIYAANARAAGQRLGALSAALEPQFAQLKGVTFIASHDAFSYLLQRFDLTLAGTFSDSSGTPPGAARLRALQAEMAAAGDICFLIEPGTSPDLIRNLGGAEAKIVQLDPLGRSQPLGPGHYEATIRGIAKDIAACAAADD